MAFKLLYLLFLLVFEVVLKMNLGLGEVIALPRE